jgi:hypothetical protein
MEAIAYGLGWQSTIGVLLNAKAGTRRSHRRCHGLATAPG